MKALGVSELIEIVPKPKGAKGFTVLYRRWVVERTFAVDGTLPASGKGCRADGGEFAGMGEAGCVSDS